MAALGLLANAVQHAAVPTDQAHREELLAHLVPQLVHLRTLVQRYLDHGRLQFAPAGGAVTVVDVAVVAATTLGRLRPLVPDGRVGRRLASAHALADPARVGSIIENLVLNAAAFSGADGEVEVRTRVFDDDVVELVVRDEGVGIPPDELPHVLRPWFRGAAAIGTEGAGLGLAIVAGHAAALGASVAITSEVGVGTQVQVLLPRGGEMRPRAGGEGEPPGDVRP